ncbi:MAG: gamma-glutamylcyclotransferase family protein [Myxococcota bacterium]|nr:gamma-glutamylcyclotransferase family protein [Myxococcota bacterium]
MTELYFAYGSNMSTARLRERIPSARPRGAASITGHKLVCNKQGKDGSGKANLEVASKTTAWGVVFEVLPSDWPRLDAFEWGYERRGCRVLVAGTPCDAQLYLAIAPGRVAIPPFDWYRDHCLHGAIEHALPEEVVGEISNWEVVSDSIR